MRVNDPNLAPGSLVPGGLESKPVGAKSSSPTARTQDISAVDGKRTGEVSGAIPGDAQDGTSISNLARSLQSMETESPERQARIAEIARSYAEGTYRPDADATARSLISDAIDNAIPRPPSSSK